MQTVISKLSVRFLLPLALLALYSTAASTTTTERKQLDNYLSLGQAKPESVRINFERKQLANGLEVVVHQDSSVQEVAVYVHYRVGSSDEWRNRTGMAHLFEHLMFQGEEHIENMRRNGVVVINGTTNKDFTNYYQLVPRHALDLALWLESRRMGNFLNLYSNDLLDKQLNVVLNEKKQRESYPAANIWPRLEAAMFGKKHSYRWPVIGFEPHLKAVTKSDIEQWYLRYYTPNNAILVLTGNITPEQGFAMAEKYFADIPRGPDQSKQVNFKAKKRNAPLIRAKDRLASDYILTGFVGPPSGHRDNAILSLICSIIESPLSIVYSRTVDKGLAKSLSCHYIERQQASLLIVAVELADDVNVKDTAEVVRRAVKHIKLAGPRPENLEAERNAILGGLYRLADNNNPSGKAQLLATNLAFTGDPGFWTTEIDHILSVTPKVIADTLEKWRKNSRMVALIDGKLDNEALAPPTPVRVGQKAPEKLKKPAYRSNKWRQAPKLAAYKPELPDVRIFSFKLSNDIPVSYSQRQGTHNTVVSVSIENAGFAHEDRDQSGIGSLAMSAIVHEDTQFVDSGYTVAEIFKLLGGYVSADASISNASITASTPEYNQLAVLQAIRALLTRPQLDSFKLDLLKQLQTDDIGRLQTNFRSIAFQKLPPLLYGDNHPYGIDLSGLGTVDTIADINARSIADWLQCQVVPQKLHIHIVSPHSADKVQNDLEQTFGHLGVGSQQTAACSKSAQQNKSLAAKTLPPAQNKIYIYHLPDLSQTAVTFAQLVQLNGKLSPTQRVARDLWNHSIGGGFASRLNIKLREEKAWSYGARSYLISPRHGQPLWVASTSVQNDKAVDAVLLMRSIIDNYINNRPATDSEIDNGRTLNLSRLAQSSSSADSLLGLLTTMSTQDIKIAELREQFNLLKTMDATKIANFGRVKLPSNNYVVLLVGDKAELTKQLRKHNLRATHLN